MPNPADMDPAQLEELKKQMGKMPKGTYPVLAAAFPD